MEGNGQEPTGSERLDRIERELELVPAYHVLFREEYKKLLASQVLLSERIERTSGVVDRLGAQLGKLTGEDPRESGQP